MNKKKEEEGMRQRGKKASREDGQPQQDEGTHEVTVEKGTEEMKKKMEKMGKKEKSNQDSGTSAEGDEVEVEWIEVPPDHWLIKRRWRIVKKNSNPTPPEPKKINLQDGGAVQDDKDEEEEEDVVYEYEVDQWRALLFMITRLIAVGALFFVLHHLFFTYVWSPTTRPIPPEEEAINRFRSLGQL